MDRASHRSPRVAQEPNIASTSNSRFPGTHLMVRAGSCASGEGAMTSVPSLLVAVSLLALAADLGASTPTRIARSSQEDAQAFARELERSYGLKLAPATTSCLSPYDHFWFEAFEQLDLDEFGLPVCTVLQAGTADGDLALRYRFTPSPALIALKSSMEKEINRVALSPREAQRWSRLRSRVNWLMLAQTGWVTLIAKERKIVRVDFTSPWESVTQKSEEKAAIQRMRDLILALRSKPIPGRDQ